LKTGGEVLQNFFYVSRKKNNQGKRDPARENVARQKGREKNYPFTNRRKTGFGKKATNHVEEKKKKWDVVPPHSHQEKRIYQYDWEPHCPGKRKGPLISLEKRRSKGKSGGHPSASGGGTTAEGSWWV